jgi:tRNA modification GTPase
MNRLLDGRDRARLLRHGATIALAGRPNVGKSSLLNALAGEDRALVHAEPGTTRDLVDAAISVGGYAVRLVDTAGIRTTHDPVEAAGVERARRTMAEADLTLLVLEAPGAPDEEDRRIAAELDRERLMVVRNKIDLGDDEAGRRFAEGLAGETATVVPVSARRGDGLDLLVDRLAGRIGHAVGDEDGVTMTSARHLEALGRADDALARAAQALAGGAWADMVAAELRESLAAIGEITGEHAGPELLDRIFSRFCIGK